MLLRLGIAFAGRGFALGGLILAACSSSASQVTKVIEPDGGGAAPSAGTGSGEGGAGKGGAGGSNGGDSGEDAGAAGIGEAGAAGAGGVPCADAGVPDTFSVPACGQTPGTTAEAYSGAVTVTIRGVLQFGQFDAMDAFYLMHVDTPSVTNGDCPDCLRYNRVSEGGCVCGMECADTSYLFGDIMTGPYPAFSPTHEYTVHIDLGSMPAERLNFGIHDCGCNDNSGVFTFTVTRPEQGCTP